MGHNVPGSERHQVPKIQSSKSSNGGDTESEPKAVGLSPMSTRGAGKGTAVSVKVTQLSNPVVCDPGVRRRA